MGNSRSFVAVLCMLGVAPHVVSAAPIDVTIACTGNIDDAIDAAIDMATPTSDVAIRLTPGNQLCNVTRAHVIGGDVTVSFAGPADGTAIFMGGSPVVPRFQVTGGASFTLSGVTVESATRGVVSVKGSRFNADNMAFLNNGSDQAGGAIVSLGGSVTVTRSVFDTNTASINGAAIDMDIATDGSGAIGSLTVSDSTFTNNQFVSTLGKGGAIYSSGVPVTLDRVLLKGNKAPNTSGGAVYIDGASLTVRNTTFTANQAPLGGAIAIANPGSNPITLSNVTLRADSASMAGSELYVTGATAASAFVITNSLISGTCAGLATSPAAHNTIESPGNTCSLPTSTNQLSVADASLNLTSLDDHGGPTATFLPQAPSAMIDAGGVGCEPVDQRDYTRNVGACDIGAVEAGATFHIFTNGFEK